MAPFLRKRAKRQNGDDLPSKPLLEYIYVDDARLDSYFEQAANPVAYDNVPTYQGTVGLTGPTVTVGAQRYPRPFTRHEKVQDGF